MLTIVRAGMVLVLALIAGCAPSPAPVTGPIPPDDGPQASAFNDAEKAFDAGQYAGALDAYNAFLREDYETLLADDALFQIGKILRLTGQPVDAIGVFSRLIREFPQGDRVPAAMLEIVSVLYETGHYEAVIAQGTAFIDTTDPDFRRLPFLQLIGDAYDALEDRLNAARYYYRAWNTASGAERERVLNALTQTIESLGVDDIQQLIVEVTDRDLLGSLLYRLGMANILDENYDDAYDAFTEFVERFPSHPAYQDASDMLVSLTERSRFIPFTVGCVLPLSGPYALFGQRALDGIELALSQIGDASDGIPFTVTVKDSRSDPGATADAVDALDRQRIGAILGPMSASQPAALRAQANGVPILVFTQREGIPDLGTYVFRHFITPRMQVNALVSYTVKALGVQRFAILYPDEHYGRRYMHLFWDQVVDNGGVVNAVEAYDPAGADFAQSIKKLAGIYYTPPRYLTADTIFDPIPRLSDLVVDDHLPIQALVPDPVERLSGAPLDRQTLDTLVRRSSNREELWHPIVDFDAVFIPDAPKKAGLVIPQLAYYDIRDVYLLGTNLWNSETLLDMSGEYMKDTLIVDGFFADSPSDRVKRFVNAFETVYQRSPGIIEAVAYDTARMLFQTMRQTATNSRRDLRRALLQIDGFDGVSGQTGFAPNGEARKQLALLRIQRGRFVQAPPRDTDESAVEIQPVRF